MENQISKKTLQIETMQKQIDLSNQVQRDLEAEVDDKSKTVDRQTDKCDQNDLKLVELRRENDELKSKIIRLETDVEANN